MSEESSDGEPALPPTRGKFSLREEPELSDSSGVDDILLKRESRRKQMGWSESDDDPEVEAKRVADAKARRLAELEAMDDDY